MIGVQNLLQFFELEIFLNIQCSSNTKKVCAACSIFKLGLYGKKYGNMFVNNSMLNLAFSLRKMS